MVKRYKSNKERRKFRNHSKMSGDSKRPRLTVFRSNRYIYIQAIDDEKGVTLATFSSLQLPKTKRKSSKTDQSKEIGASFAKILSDKKIKVVVFDRGSYQYHGRVKVLAESIREGGIKI